MQRADEFYANPPRNYVRNIAKVDWLCLAFEANYKPDFTYIGELHPFWEFVYVLSDSVCVSADDRIYRLNEGDIIFHKPMEFHRIWAVDNIPPHVFIMSFSLDGDIIGKLEHRVVSLSSEQKTEMLRLLNYLKKNTSHTRTPNHVTYFFTSWNDSISQNIANRLESLLLTFENIDKSIEKNEYIYDEIKTYRQILNILSENVYTWISLDDIAKKCNLGKSQIKKIFADNSPTPIHKYFIRLKIGEAMTLLLSGFSVEETSDKLEFSSPNYFSTVFKRETGVSPHFYKKNNRLVN